MKFEFPSQFWEGAASWFLALIFVSAGMLLISASLRATFCFLTNVGCGVFQ